MDRRRFLRSVGLGLAGVSLADFLAACADPPVVATSTATTAVPDAVNDAASSVPAAPPPTAATATTAAPAPPIPQPLGVGAICPEAWGAKPAKGVFETHTIERLTVHHTAAALTDNRRAPAALRGHQAYHQSLGWPDLAYHVAVDANGNIYAGRPTTARGDTGTNYDPSGHFLVVAEGNFNAQEIPPAQVAGVAAVLAWAATEFSVDPATIRGHRDWAATSCPGEAFYPLISDGTLRSMVEERIDAGGIDLSVVCDDTAYSAVAAIEAGETPPVLGAKAGFYLRDSNSAGNADRVIEFGQKGWIPLSGTFER